MKVISQLTSKIKKAIKGILASPAQTFAIIAGITGLFMIFLTPPLAGADEEAHFVRAYGITQGDFRLYETNKVAMPQSYRKTLGCIQDKQPSPGKVYAYEYGEYAKGKKQALLCALNIPLNESSTEKVKTSAGPYSPTTYIPQTIVIAIGRLLDIPIIAMVYLVRLAILASFIGLIVAAIKLTPVRKWALAGIALLPHAIGQITNPGADYLLLGLAAIIVAVVLRSLYVSKAILKKENVLLISILAAASLMIVLPKGPFPGVLILPLVAFYGGLGYEKWKKGVILGLSLLVALLWYQFGMSVVTPWREAVEATSLLDFPLAFFKTMFFGWVETDFIQVGTMIRDTLNAGMPSLVVTIINFLAAIYMFVGYREQEPPARNTRSIRLLGITGVLLSIGIIVGSFAALYIGVPYSQNDEMIIMGVQARYFYPAFIILAMLPLYRFVKTDKSGTYEKITIAGAIAVSVALILTLAFIFSWIKM